MNSHPKGKQPHRVKFRNWSALRYWLVWAYEGPVPKRALIGDYGTPKSTEISSWLIRRGQVKVKASGKTVTARKGEWLFVSTSKRHQHFSEDCELLSLHVSLSWPGNMPVIEQPEPYVVNARNFPALEKSALSLVKTVKANFPEADANLTEHESDMFTFLEVQQQLPLWIKHYLAVQATHGITATRLDIEDDRILKIINELDTRPLNRRFSEKELIQLVGISQSRLNFLFNQVTGMTPKRYFERRRKEAACKLLRSTQMSIKEIGFELGFRFDSHFSHWFSKQTGSTPSELRKPDIL